MGMRSAMQDANFGTKRQYRGNAKSASLIGLVEVCRGPTIFTPQTMYRGNAGAPSVFLELLSFESQTVLYRPPLPAAAAAALIGEAALIRTFIVDGVFDITPTNP